MGAGSRKDHYIQDAAEAYIVYRLQDLAVKNNTALTNSAEDKKKLFDIYCYDRDITSDFEKSIYKDNIDAIVDGFYSDLVNEYPNRKFDFVDVEKEFRDKKWKGDFIIQFEDESYVSFSLKNYKKGFDRIQLCSGTWHSFLNNFLFKSAGVGTFIDPYTQKVFQGCNYEYRDSLVDRLGYSDLKNVYNFFDSVNETIKSFYAYGDTANQWSNVSNQWKQDCASYGLEAATRIIDALNGIENDKVKIEYSKIGLFEIKNSVLNQSLEIVRRRIDETGTKEPTIIRRGNDRILIELPGLDDPNRIKKLLGKTANLSFRMVSETEDTFGSELLSFENMCIEPPLPLQIPELRPNISAIIPKTSQPFAIQWPCPL